MPTGEMDAREMDAGKQSGMPTSGDDNDANNTMFRRFPSSNGCADKWMPTNWIARTLPRSNIHGCQQMDVHGCQQMDLHWFALHFMDCQTTWMPCNMDAKRKWMPNANLGCPTYMDKQGWPTKWMPTKLDAKQMDANIWMPTKWMPTQMDANKWMPTDWIPTNGCQQMDANKMDANKMDGNEIDANQMDANNMDAKDANTM